MLMPASGSCTQRARWREIVGWGGDASKGEVEREEREKALLAQGGDSPRSTWAQRRAEECMGGEGMWRFVTWLLKAEYLSAAPVSEAALRHIWKYNNCLFPET